MTERTGLHNLRQSRDADAAPKRQEVLVAVLRLLNREGYHEMTMEGLAREAGVNKTTLYRWWSGKPAVVADALAALMSTGPVPDTGSSREDFILMARITIRNYGQTALGATVAALITDLTSDPDGLAEFRRSFVEARRSACMTLFERAVERGDMTGDEDPELIMDMIAGAIIYRKLVTGASVEESLAEEFVSLILGPDKDGGAQKPGGPAEPGAPE